MYVSHATPFDRLRWTSRDLADAVPLRLHEIDLFDAANQGAANALNEPRQRLRIAHGYRSAPEGSTRFRIR